MLGMQASHGTRPHRTHKAATLASDVDDGTPSAYTKDLPPPSTAGALSAAAVADDDKKMNGDALHPGDFDWERVGWAPRFGLPVPEGVDMDSLMTDQSTWLEERLQDKFFGDWYHNTAIIFFCAFASYTAAVLGGGLGWLFIILAVCATYYRTSIRRVRRRHRDDINREMQKERLESDTESLEWINSFLVKFWPIIQPMIGETIIRSVDQVLSTAKPPFLEDLRLRDFTLGTKPPRMEHVKTYPKTEEDAVLMDWKFSFTPNDTADMTARQLKVKINPKIVLEVRVGKGVVSKGLDVIVQDMECTGTMRVKVKLQLSYPFVDRVEICFLDRPHFDYVCKPLGGDTFGFDINFIPGLESFIQEQIHANLGPMMYNPHVFPIEVAKMLAGSPVDQAIGVLQIQFHGAQALKNPDPLAGTPDPYATVSIAGRQELGRTKTIEGNANPKWNETVNVVISSLKDDLNLKVFDFNDFRKDKELGEANFALDKFEKDDEYENEQLPLMLNGRPRGQIQCDLRFFPVLQGTKLEDGTVEPAPESLTGICKFTVTQAKELDADKSVVGQLNPYAVLLLNGKEVHISKKLKRTNNPVWPDASKELLITNRKTAKLGLVIKDDRDLGADPVLGTYQIKLDDLIELSNKGQDWFRLASAKTGRAQMSVQWRPVALRGAIAGSGYIEPIGVIRLYFKNARELRNVETVGKSDPYARVLLSGIQKGRTVTWQNNLNPDWDEVIYVPVHSDREKLTVEVMDEESVGKDRSLGYFDVGLSEYIHKDEDGLYEVNHTKEVIAQTLTSGSGKLGKGTVNYTCSFFPVIPTVDPEEEESEKKENATANGDTTPGTTDPKKSVDSSRKSVEDSTAANSSVARERSDTSGTISSLKTAGSTTAQSDKQKNPSTGETEQDEIAGVKEVPKIRLTEDNLLDYGQFSWWHQGDTSEFLGNIISLLIKVSAQHFVIAALLSYS
jgi:Ca2+-dependent lipid-binding protein